MGEHVTDLVHQVDAKVLVLDPHMHVHPADDHLASDDLVVGGDALISGLLGRFLFHPVGEGVGRGGDDRSPIFLDHA